MSSLYDNTATPKNTDRLAQELPVHPLMLHGHTRSVHSVAFLPDGKVVSGSPDKTVRVWEVEDGRGVGTVMKEESKVDEVATSTDGQWIATGNWEGRIIIWNATTHEQVFKLEGHSDWVYSLAFSLDSARVVSGSYDKTVIIWSTMTGERLVGPLHGAMYGIDCVSFSANGANIAGCDAYNIQIWDSRSGKLVIPPIQSCATSLAWTSGDEQLIAGCFDGSIRSFDSSTGSLIAEWNGHTDGICSIAVSPNEQFMASGSDDNTVRLWDITTRQQIGPALQHNNYVFSVAISPDGNHLASGGGDREVSIWSLRGIIPLSLLGNTAPNHAVRAKVSTCLSNIIDSRTYFHSLQM
jgi:WD40 repeat protein